MTTAAVMMKSGNGEKSGMLLVSVYAIDFLRLSKIRRPSQQRTSVQSDPGPVLLTRRRLNMNFWYPSNLTGPIHYYRVTLIFDLLTSRPMHAVCLQQSVGLCLSSLLLIAQTIFLSDTHMDTQKHRQTVTDATDHCIHATVTAGVDNDF